jgi:hypothetical protein
MADPFSGIAAVGTAASIIQIVQVGLQAGNRIRNFLSQQPELPKNLKATHERLGLLAASLEQMELAQDDEEDPRMKSLLHGMVNRVVELNNILTECLPKQGATKMTSIAKALKSIAKDDKVSKLDAALHADTIQLGFFINTRYRNGPSQGLKVIEFTHLTGQRLFEVPSRSLSTFIGRTQFLSLLGEMMNPESDGGPIVVLQGMGGQGKTQIALQYCETAWESNRFHSVFWINATLNLPLSRACVE